MSNYIIDILADSEKLAEYLATHTFNVEVVKADERTPPHA